MAINLLLVHGNGGAATRFELFLPKLAVQRPDVRPVIPMLPGFAGRPWPLPTANWEPFLNGLSKAVADRAAEPWIFYGHGIGGSLLLEWASRGYELVGGGQVQPQRVILHAPVGASLQKRFFPRLMKPRLMRNFIHWLIYQDWLQVHWGKRLFLYPERIPTSLKRQFFQDYRECAAFPVFFDLITPTWYNAVQAATKGRQFHFIWGEKERVIASKHLALWQNDYPTSTFEIIPEWDHFPMLEQVDAFVAMLDNLLIIN